MRDASGMLLNDQSLTSSLNSESRLTRTREVSAEDATK